MNIWKSLEYYICTNADGDHALRKAIREVVLQCTRHCCEISVKGVFDIGRSSMLVVSVSSTDTDFFMAIYVQL